MFSVFHIEDDPIWVDIVRKVTERLPGVIYIGAAPTSENGLAVCAQRAPDVLVLDLGLPGSYDGFQVASSIGRFPRTRILLLSCRSDDRTLYTALRPEICGAIMKCPRAVDELSFAICEVASGRRYLSPLMRNAVTAFRQNPCAFFKILSDAELALLPVFASGRSDDEIAGACGRSVSTIHSHRQSIMSKLKLHRSVELAVWAAQRGFLGGVSPVGSSGLYR